MDKMYQVFLSSTYLDLIKERKAVMDTLITIGCIPRGMELFPANNIKLLDTIEMTIKECDYYLLLVGGRYGSINKEHKLSYTEIEYNLALKADIPILPFLINSAKRLSPDKCEKEQRKKVKLMRFIEKIKENNTPLYWNSSRELALLVNRSISNAVKTCPRPGLIRGFSLEKSYKGKAMEECYSQYNEKLVYCLNQGIFDEYISRNITITPDIKEEYFNIRSVWKFKSISLNGTTPEFSFNVSSRFVEFPDTFKLISYKVNNHDMVKESLRKIEIKFNQKTRRYFVLFSDSLEIDKEKSVEVECIYDFKESLPEYNSYSSYMYPAKSRDVEIIIDGKDSGAWVLKANSFTAFRNLGNNINALWSNRDNYVENKSDSSYSLNIKEWTLPGTGFAFTVSKREHTTQCWKPKA